MTQTQNASRKRLLLRNVATWAIVLVCGCSTGGGASGTSGTTAHTVKIGSITPFNRIRIDKATSFTVEGEPIYEFLMDVPATATEVQDSRWEMEAEAQLEWNSTAPVRYRAQAGIKSQNLHPNWFGDEYEFTANGSVTTLEFVHD